MTPQNRGLHSHDPLDHFGDPADQFHDPADQPSANTDFDAISPVDVAALRIRLHMTQRRFAGLFGFAVATLRHWERGNRVPTGTALVLLNVIRENPRVVLQAVRKARLRDPASVARMEPPGESYRAPRGFGERGPARRPRGKRRPKTY